jgi:trehalose 2-sulfotransferase
MAGWSCQRRVTSCALARASGTELLCRGLAATGVAGRPEEYFLAEDPVKMPDWRFWEEGPYAAGPDVSGRESYLSLAYRLGSTPNGVFGAKIHWNCLRWALAKFSEMPCFAGLDRAAILRTAFPGLRVVDVTRRDRIRQAVSWARMAQDGMWLDPRRPAGACVAAPCGPAALRLRAHPGSTSSSPA